MSYCQKNIKHFLLLLAFMPFSLLAQQKVSITLKDKQTSEPIPYAHLCFEDQKSGKQSYLLSDLKGQAIQTIEGKTVLATSVMGYKTRMDTLTGVGELIILLEPSLFDMDEVVVTAQMSPKRADQSIYQVKVINSKLISEKSANNLSDLLSGELNLRVSKGGALGSSMSINGLSGEHVKILIDGVPVTGRMNGNIDLSQLNLNNVDHIEIVEGPMSVQYGSNALAGAINIITKENLRNKFLASANTYYESVGVYNGNAALNFNKNNNSFSLTGGRNFFGGFSRPDTSRSQLWKPKEQYFSDAYYIFKKNKIKFRVDGKYFQETILDKGNIRRTNEIWAFDSYFITERLTAKAQLTGPVGEYSNFDIMTSWSGYSALKNIYRKDFTSLEKILIKKDPTTFSTYLTRGNYAWQPESGIFAMQAGLDLNYERGEGKRIENEFQEIGDYAVYLSTQYNPIKSISLQPGFRLAYNTRYKAPWVPSINLKWTPVKQLNIRFSYVRGFRAPTLKELYLDFVDINHNVKGNPDLKSENSHNLNASFQYDNQFNNNFYGIELNTFSNIVNSQISLVPIDSTTMRYSYRNINEYRSLGYNVKFKYRLHPRLNVNFGISKTGMMPVPANQEVKFEDFYFATDYTVDFRYDLFKYGINIAAFYKFSGKYPYYYFLDNGDDVTVGIMDSYNNLDLTLNKSFLKKNLVMSIGGKNLFDITNIPIAGAGNGGGHTGGGGNSFVGWGRTFFIGLSYKFGTF